MAEIKMGDLPSASSFALTDEALLRQASATKKVTLDQLNDLFDAMVLLGTQVASSSPSLDFTSLITSAYDEFYLHFAQIIPAIDSASLLLRLSSNNGSNWDAGATDYAYSTRRDRPGASQGTTESTGDTSVFILSGLGSAANENASGVIRLSNPLFTGGYKTIFYNSMYQAASAQPMWLIGAGCRLSATAMNAVRLLMSSGNIASGWARLYGVKK